MADPHCSYTFGDTALAAARLELLADVFEDTTAVFLSRVAGGRRRLAVDLGCGPGFTTVLLDDVIAPEQVVGIDSSVAFAGQAATRLGSHGEVICADVLDLPARVRDADLIFTRFLLTHLSDPTRAIEHWLSRVAPHGVVAVQEVESITTDEPTLTRYLELQRRMLQANGNSLEIGPAIASAQMPGAALRNAVVRVTPLVSAAARMFAMNFEGWRTKPVVASLATATELDQIAAGLRALSTDDDYSEASIAWELRELILCNPRSTMPPA